jgi:hypothetical protein
MSEAWIEGARVKGREALEEAFELRGEGLVRRVAEKKGAYGIGGSVQGDVQGREEVGWGTVEEGVDGCKGVDEKES